MATNANLKSALSHTGNQIGLPNRTIGNAALLRLQAWFESEFAAQLGGNSSTADDISAYITDHLEQRVRQFENTNRAAANTEPPVADLTE